MEKHQTSSACWLKQLDLSRRDRLIIEDGYWLNDKIIWAALKLMEKAVPTTAGLQDVILAVKYGFKVDPTRPKFCK